MTDTPGQPAAQTQPESVSPTTVCIIGGSGFIGTRLTQELQGRGRKVRVADVVPPVGHGPGTEYAWADVREAASLLPVTANCGTIVNLAAAHRDDVKPRRLYDEINVDGARNVCKAAEANGIDTIVFTSSVAVYGSAPENASETQPHRPSNDYGRTKSEAERVYLDWQARNPGARRLVIVRPTVVFGPGNRGNVYTLMSQVATGRFLMVGDGENRKSMAYVDNVCGFLAHLLTGRPGVQIFNYVDKPDLTMNELVAIVRESLGMPARAPLRVPYWLGMGIGYGCDMLARATRTSLAVSRIRVEKFCASTVFAADRALTQTDFVPRVPLHIGLQHTIAADFGLRVPLSRNMPTGSNVHASYGE
jgi:nucleoside-diphosphate-sugar epimerase